MNRICCIFAGSPEVGVPCLPIPDDAYMLCADSGLRLAELLGIKPDLVLGDFDSLGKVPSDLPHMTAPIEKDDTDTMLAVRYALAKGYRKFRIYGAFGGRLDHTLANLQTLRFLHSQGAEGILIGINDYLTLQPSGTRCYPKLDGFSFSVFAAEQECTGVTLSGVYYPLTNAALTNTFPIGVSNQIIADHAEVTCGTGMLFIIGSRIM